MEAEPPASLEKAARRKPVIRTPNSPPKSLWIKCLRENHSKSIIYKPVVGSYDVNTSNNIH